MLYYCFDLLIFDCNLLWCFMGPRRPHGAHGRQVGWSREQGWYMATPELLDPILKDLLWPSLGWTFRLFFHWGAEPRSEKKSILEDLLC